MDNNQAPVTSVTSTIAKIKETVKGTILGSSEKITSAIVDQMATIEIDKRVKIAFDAVKKHEILTKSLEGISRPDQSSFDVDKNEVKTYSSGRISQIKKDEKFLNEFTETIEKAFSENTADAWDKLNNKLNQASQAPKAGEGKNQPKDASGASNED